MVADLLLYGNITILAKNLSHMSHTLDIQHFVFATKSRRPVIPMLAREHLYRMIWHLLKERRCTLYRINGIEDHVHMVVNVHSSISKAKLIQEIKSHTSQWMRKSGLFPDFDGWCDGFFSESKDPMSLDTIINYVRNQEVHHKGEGCKEELEKLYRHTGREWDERELS